MTHFPVPPRPPQRPRNLAFLTEHPTLSAEGVLVGLVGLPLLATDLHNGTPGGWLLLALDLVVAGLLALQALRSWIATQAGSGGQR